jgi:hypothetical protein
VGGEDYKVVRIKRMIEIGRICMREVKKSKGSRKKWMRKGG